MTIVCGDSHTSTHGAFGALAFGIGTSEVEHVLATQTLQQRKPRSMRISYSGELPPGVTAKDLILATIGRIGVDGGVGHVIEYSGPAIQGLSMEGRMTVCNMTIEGGGRAGMIAPDDTTFEWVEGRPARPGGLRGRRRGLARPPQRRRSRASTPRWRSTPASISPAGELGHESGDGGRRDRRGARAASDGRPAGARVHGPGGRHADPGDPARPGLRGLVHQLPHRRPARRGRDRAGPPGGLVGGCDGGARLGPGEGPGRGRGARRGLQGCRLRLALGRLLDVPRDEPGHARARASAAPPPRTATSRAVRAAAGAPTWSARRWPPPPRSRAASSTSGSGHEGRDRHRGPACRCSTATTWTPTRSCPSSS